MCWIQDGHTVGVARMHSQRPPLPIIRHRWGRSYMACSELPRLCETRPDFLYIASMLPGFHPTT